MKYNELLEKYTQIRTYGYRGVRHICIPWNEERVNRCQAWYGFQDDVEDIIILRSYQTVIAIYDKRENIVYDFLRAVYGYTPTSCQHIRKFADKMRYSFNKPGTIKDYPQVIRIDE